MNTPLPEWVKGGRAEQVAAAAGSPQKAALLAAVRNFGLGPRRDMAGYRPARLSIARRRVERPGHNWHLIAYRVTVRRPIKGNQRLIPLTQVCALNDRIRPVAGTTIDGQRAFAFAISESVF